MLYSQMPFYLPPLLALNIVVGALLVGVPFASLLGAIVIRACAALMNWEGPSYWEAVKASAIGNVITFIFFFSFFLVIGRGRTVLVVSNDISVYALLIGAVLGGHAVVFANVLRDRSRQGPGVGRAMFLALAYTAAGLAVASLLAFISMIAAPPL
ncbi:MAG: hypothetical protein NTW19_22140 [Planctomycetota bacterium]|nr:hypothetical protein [Planctomycetota bacterium]